MQSHVLCIGSFSWVSEFFDLALDGKRFAVVQEQQPEQDGPTRLTFLLNFFDELRRRAPSGK